MSVGHTCGYMDVQGVRYSLVPSGITPDTYVCTYVRMYILVRVHLLRCPIVLERLFNQNVHSLFPCDLFFAGESTVKTGQARGDNQTTVIRTKLRQTVDEIHVQQTISTVGLGKLETSPRSRELLCLLACKEGPYQDRPVLCPFRLSPLLTCS